MSSSIRTDGGTRTDGEKRPAEVRALVAIQDSVGSLPGAVPAARGLSHFGEHALGWIAIGGLGMVVDAPRREQWATVAVGAVGAHAASIVVKRIARRRRPTHPAVRIGVSTPSKFSFPSSHATSTTAAAVLIGRATSLPVAAAIAAPMMLSRLVLGVHYPSDVVLGAALGAVSASIAVRTEHTVAVRLGLTATTAGAA